MDGFGSFTSKVAEALLPLPPLVEAITPVVLSLVPAVEPVTVTLKVQLLFALSVPPLKLMVSGAEVIKVPPHCGVDESTTVTPVGRTSVKAIPFKVVLALGLVITNLRTVVLPVWIGVGENDLARLGGAMTVNESVANPLVVLFVPDSVDEIYPLTFSR